MLMIFAGILSAVHLMSISDELLTTGTLLAPRLSFSTGLAEDVVSLLLPTPLFDAYPCKPVGCF